ncbi:tetratricopeptide repeat protein [Candidatus Methylospira mobilis]|uniref:tetratricopeptide repeat protein n=1 Tax=Candidatus Methylospira mobilis TaxID=1808979 RepID=UPI0028E2343C|nr:tetratricopeptide repeat protein [Candidatus Methylospira mobilis]WNV03975.1 tetratricopeptide repeat protein [Candidatus Methylospira mobilis]
MPLNQQTQSATRPTTTVETGADISSLLSTHSEQTARLALDCHTRGDSARAMEILRPSLTENPQDSSLLCLAGAFAYAQQHFEQAEQYWNKAIEADIACAAAHFNLGRLYENKKDRAAAEAAYRRALEIDEHYPDAHINLAQLLKQQKQLDEAERHYRAALTQSPHIAEIHYNLAHMLHEQQRLPEAEPHYRMALQHQPDMITARNNLAVLLRITGREQEAEQHFRQILTDPNAYPLCAWNFSSLLLGQGRYAEGWQLHEWRYHVEHVNRKAIPPEVGFPRWQGEALAGKSLVIWPEQGFGDQIQFARYGKQLKQMGITQLTLVCDSPLLGLLLSAPGFDSVLPLQQAQKRLDPHDYWVFPLSLPLFCHETPETIPAELPYVWAWTQRHEYWLERLPAAETGRRVGLAWKGNAEHGNDAQRSLPGLSTLKPLWGVGGIRFISLQKGAGNQEALDAATSSDQSLLALGSELRDFADTAAVIAALDLVICVDTAVAHLAGALGKPVWLLLPALGTDWRWLHERCDSSWYPDVMRLFRQQTPGDWDGVMEQVKLALYEFVRQPPAPAAEIHEPRTIWQYHTLAGIAEYHGEFELAAHLCLEALEQTTPTDPIRHELIVRGLYSLKKSGDLSSAISLAEREMPNWQHSPDFFFALGDLMLDWAMQNPDKALNEILPIVEASWLKCLEIGEQPSLPGSVAGRGSHLAAHNLAVFHDSLGNTERARLYREKGEQMKIESEQPAIVLDRK